jgi:signal transduction histidine kinase
MLMDDCRTDLERFIDCVPIGIILLNSDLHIEMRNDLSLELLEVGVENLLTPNFLEIIKEHGDLQTSILQVHSGALHQQRVILALANRTLNCTVLNAGRGVAGGCIVLIEDATQINKIEQIKREFIGTLLHKIRGPLATMKTSLSMIGFETQGSGPRIPPEVREIFHMCREEVNRLSLLINDMRDLFLIETKLADKDFEPEDFSVDAAIKGAINDLKKSLLPEIVDTRIRMEGNAGRVIHADYEKTKKIFYILLKNALQYSPPETPVTVSCSVTDEFINLIIKDRGIGIADSLYSQVFTKYFREDNFATRNTTGNGLGLFIAKSYVDMMDGTMYFDSKQGEGSSFYVTLPVTGRK